MHFNNINKILVINFIFLFAIGYGYTQERRGELGNWYMYFFSSGTKKSPWGFQGDVQYRSFDLVGDLEQLLLRGGLTYQPKESIIKFTLGYGHITTGSYASSGPTIRESRIYQEALYPVKFGSRIFSLHRLRYEQRFVDDLRFRTRYRYNFFLNIPMTGTDMSAGTVYIAFYNELFINGQRKTTATTEVEVFDRNRLYVALGYMIKRNIKVQLGIMNQTSDTWSKNQLQISFHQTFL